MAYESKAIIKTIKATSRASVKVGESYYTVEYSEERIIPDIEEVNIEEERQLLWDDVNAECDNQIEDILKTFKK
jgi:CTP:phosphocholine cytidylyltransferase-like protein